MTVQTAARTQAAPIHGGPAGFIRVRAGRDDGSAEVLFEQLAYLIQFADQERDRLERVKAVLMETFN